MVSEGKKNILSIIVRWHCVDIDYLRMRYCLKLAPFLLIGVQSFVPTVSFRKSRLAQLLSNGPIEYNDFDFVVGGDGDAGGEDYETRALQQRVAEFRSQEVEKDTHLSKNWRQGNWKVQGFALDKHDPADDTAAQIHISKVIVGAEADSIVVGRTDGSVCVVEMGTEYCTRFVSKLKATAGVNDTVSFESEMVRLDDQIDETIMRGAPKRERDLTETTEIPFEVSHQFMAHDQSAITALHTTESETGNVVVTGSKNGQITIWNVPDDQDEKVTPVRNLEAHSDEVVAIEAVSMTDDDEPHLLLSVSIDGSLALWDIWTGDSIYQCEMMSDDGDQQLPILCAAANSKEVFLGLANGEVVVYSIPDMVECASMGGTCPVPNGKFMAQAGGVTAIQCAGEGTLAASSRSNTASSVLLTGGKDGVVKQW